MIRFRRTVYYFFPHVASIKIVIFSFSFSSIFLLAESIFFHFPSHGAQETWENTLKKPAGYHAHWKIMESLKFKNRRRHGPLNYESVAKCQLKWNTRRRANNGGASKLIVATTFSKIRADISVNEHFCVTDGLVWLYVRDQILRQQSCHNSSD